MRHRPRRHGIPRQDHECVPRLVEFENNQDEYERLDEVQAMNMALCFLCSINADASDVEKFLCGYPEALLLEGASRIMEESAKFILLTRHCHCGPESPCQRNRQAILDDCLSHEALHYLRKRHAEAHDEDTREDGQEEQKPASERARHPVTLLEHRQDLIMVERDVRLWRREEFKIQQQLLELTATQHLHHEAHEPNRLVRWVACNTNTHNRRVGMERARRQRDRDASIQRLRQRQQALLIEIRRARQLQFQLFNFAFHGVQRHVCTRERSG